MAVISQQIKPLYCFKVHRHPCLNVLRVARDLSPQVTLCVWDHQGKDCTSILSLERCEMIWMINGCKTMTDHSGCVLSQSSIHEWHGDLCLMGIFSWVLWSSIIVRCSGCANMGILQCRGMGRTYFGTMRNWPTARWRLKPNLMMVCKCVFTPHSAHSLRATPIKLHYAAAVMGFREVLHELTKAGVSCKTLEGTF